jgi:thymidylate synthase
MAVVIRGHNVPQAFVEGLWVLRTFGASEDSRAGPVITIQEPVELLIRDPRERVLTCPERDANPFFHVMEFVWMMAGSRTVGWLKQFNKRIEEYADNGIVMNAAYGHRWRYNFFHDQIQRVVEILRKDVNTRRAVIAMWDPNQDLDDGHKDYACNTHIYFRSVNGRLDMTVCNRSNDFVWGMMGANAVHMTLLHELIAHYVGLELGLYRVLTNNLHIYTEKYGDMLRNPPIEHDVYLSKKPIRLITDRTSLSSFLEECEMFVAGDFKEVTNSWLKNTALPIYLAYTDRLYHQSDGTDRVSEIEAPDWREACGQWIARKTS